MIAFGTVIYNSAMQYFEDFIYSINNQTYKDFVLIIINDNVPESVFHQYINGVNIPNLVVVDSKGLKSPVQLRIELLREAKKRNYGLLILGDCDDKFDFNRVKRVTDVYEKNQDRTFFYNDLLLFEHKRAMNHLPQVTEKIENILESNYLGLSNTAINLNRISNSFIESLNECDTFVFDWYLFSRLLLNGNYGIFVSGAFSFYRIHGQNYAGLSVRTQENVRKEYEIKIKHYSILSKYDEIYKSLLKKYKTLDIRTIDPDNSKSDFWWSNIKLSD